MRLQLEHGRQLGQRLNGVLGSTAFGRLGSGVDLLHPRSIDHDRYPPARIGSDEIFGRIVADIDEARLGAAERSLNVLVTLLVRSVLVQL